MYPVGHVAHGAVMHGSVVPLDGSVLEKGCHSAVCSLQPRVVREGCPRKAPNKGGRCTAEPREARAYREFSLQGKAEVQENRSHLPEPVPQAF